MTRRNAMTRLPPTAPLTLDWVLDELAVMRGHGLAPVLFGGWAKELLGAWPDEPHDDLDVLVVAEDTGDLDAFIAARGATPFRHKRHAHKRAYLDRDRLVELFLVRPAPAGLVTDFYGHYRRSWLSPLARDVGVGDHTVAVATPRNIAAYEGDHARVQDALYASRPELRAEVVRRHGSARIPCRNPLAG
jgi:hypothetical protein